MKVDLEFKDDDFACFTVSVDNEFGVGMNQYKFPDQVAHDLCTLANSILREKLGKLGKICIEEIKKT